MKSWKKSWLKELDSITPKLSDEVKDAPIPARGETAVNDGGVAVKARYNSKTLIITAAAILLCLAIVGLAVFLPKKPSASVFTVEINPTVNFVTDGSGTVTGVMAVNGDADVILSAEEVYQGLLGKKIDEAVTLYVDYAARLGYLDISKDGAAVRISGCKDSRPDKLLADVNDALQGYFTKKGVYAVAITEAVDLAEYKLRSGMAEVGSLTDMVKFVTDSKTLTLQRNSENMSTAQLQSSYKELVGDYDDFMLSNIKDNVNKIVNSAADVKKLAELNKAIEQSGDNPSFLLKDYWSVKTYYSATSYTQEFSALMGEMETALNDYKTDYGVEFADKWSLLMADAKFGKLPVPLEKLQEWLDALTAGMMEAFSAVLSDVMEIAGVLDEKLGELMKLPENAAEYVTKASEVLKHNFDKRAEEYKATYGQARDEISAKNYADYLSGIAERYGSLGEYWNAAR